MFTNKLKLLLCALSLIGIGACSTTDSTPAGTVTGNTMSAKIDGANWNSTITVSTSEDGDVVIGGTDNTIGISIGVSDARTTGVYQIGPISAENMASITESTTKLWMAGATFGSGTITFTKLTSTDAEGTFTISAVPSPTHPSTTGTKTVTEGKFAVKFTKK